MLYKKVLIPLALLSTAIFAIGYGITRNYEPLIQLFTQESLMDSIETDNPPPSIKDMSSMFNERGFYSSNGFTADESEMINDFNGNLMYEIPLYNYKLGGEMQYDVKLVYNSSVGHQVNLGNKDTWITAKPSVYNFNAPEWILSLNGIAVQVFNFEPNFFSNATMSIPYTIKDYNLNLLIPGYHFNNANKTIGGTERDRINILSGDGSTITLVNKSWQSSDNDSLRYKGTYHSEGKESHYKAIVSFIPGQNDVNADYRNRIVELIRGDGMVFVFQEYNRNYMDLVVDEITGTGRRPQMLLLKEIKDRFGYILNLAYNFTTAPSTMGGVLYGRPLLTGINSNVGMIQDANISILYSGSKIKTLCYSDVNKNYTFDITQSSFYYSNESNIGSVTKITNPMLQTTDIEYQPENYYIRELSNVVEPINDHTITISANMQRRISKYTNYLGGSREYTYFPNTGETKNRKLSIIMNISAYNISKNVDNETNYKGYGREPFYSNMIYTKKEKNGTQYKNETTFIYDYTDAGSNYSTLPVDDNDTYKTEKSTSSLDNGTNNNSSTSVKSLRTYKVYPVRYESQGMPEVQDFNGITKLIKEEFYNTDNNSVYASNEYTYIVDPHINNIRYDGSFLMSNKKSYVQSKLRETNYEYSYAGGSDKLDSLITEYVETDPKGNKSYIKYDNFYRLVNANHAVSGYNGETSGTLVYYRSGVPLIEARYNSSGNPLSTPNQNILTKKTNTYIDTDNNSLGYFGQLISEKVYNQLNFSSYIETKYEYYKLDNTGNELYMANSLPYKEGNIRMIIKPDGEEVKYFYHPITASENVLGGGIGGTDDISYPKISYKIRFNDGTDSVVAEYIWDNRLPTRIDSYKRTGTNTADTLKKVYMQYNAAGMPKKIINEHNYLTQIIYQPTHRVSSVTLPGDFSHLPNDTTYDINESYFNDTVNASDPAWGLINHLDNNKLNSVNAPQSLRECKIFYSKLIINSSNTTTDKSGAYIRINGVPNFAEVISASLKFSVANYTHTINGSPAGQNDYVTTLKPITSISNVGGFVCNSMSADSTRKFKIENNSQNISISLPNPGQYNVQNVDVTSLLNTTMGTQHKNLFGFYISTGFSGTWGEPLPECNFTLDLNIINATAPADWVNWRDNHMPVLTIYGSVDASDTLRTVILNGGTYIYEYDDANKNVTIHSRLSHSPNKLKKIKYNFDGFGNIKEKDVYTSSSAFDDFNFAFNFMNQPAENIDARNNSTKLSYDYLGRQKKTLNADNTYSTTDFAYDNTLGSYFSGSYSGFVEKQTFTDETGRQFDKYFDAVGNLLREEKTVAAASGNSQIPAYEDQPYDPDTTYEGQDAPANWLALRTDYKYDELYRLIEVKTPGGKTITYNYDSYGRQSKRVTPDAGTTRYSYDNNGNLILSQDANQLSKSSSLNTRRTYDGLNRLLSISDYKLSGIPTETGPMGDTLLPFEFDTPPSTDSLYIINVYDTLTTAIADIFNSIKPSDYNSAPNYTRGSLVATAYRTVLGEAWGYKFYRYDERGNVTKLWNYIVGLGWKTEIYYHNGQSQLTRNWYQSGQSDSKLFTYGYDDAARLDYVNQYVGAQPEDPENEGDTPGAYFTLTKYTYDENSQIDLHKLNNNSLTTNYNYNNRNWIFTTSQTGVSSAIFRYTLLYNANGNIRKQISIGTYRSNFADNSDLWMTYIYDNSNRLLKADRDSGVTGNTHDLIDGYDKDGNFVGMKRYGSSNNLADDFGYSYFSGTNRLQTIGEGLTSYSYTYDNNGNMTSDQLNRTGSIKYDHRNLMTEIRVIRSEAPSIFEPPVDVLYLTQYRYDEAGNRVRKIRYKYTGSTPDPVFDLSGDAPPWTLQSDEYYVRDISGKEIAIYSGSSLTQWNIWGLDNIGKINADTTRNYYLKDHLGSIRVVLNSTNTVISAQDYDAWGYPLENRTYNASAMKYDFTGKERDQETSYDYFGARYYDSRIGRWGQVEPLLEKYLTVTPYAYSLSNPIKFLDINGLDAKLSGNQKAKTFDALSSTMNRLGLQIDDNGNLSYSNMPFRPTVREIALMNAIDNPNIKAVLRTTNSNFVPEPYNDPKYEEDPLLVGRYTGSYVNAEGQLIATNFFNYNLAKKYHYVGGSSEGESALHELLEAYFGAYFYPNTNYSQSFTQAHEIAKQFDVTKFSPDYEPHGVIIEGTGRIRLSYVDIYGRNGIKKRFITN